MIGVIKEMMCFGVISSTNSRPWATPAHSLDQPSPPPTLAVKNVILMGLYVSTNNYDLLTGDSFVVIRYAVEDSFQMS